MNKKNKPSNEAGGRAVRKVLELRGKQQPLRAAMEPMAPKIGSAPQKQPGRVKQPDVDVAVRPPSNCRGGDDLNSLHTAGVQPERPDDGISAAPHDTAPRFRRPERVGEASTG